MTRLFVFSVLFVAGWGWGHEAGHGPKIPGPAPHGGQLAAIVSAGDVSKGRLAKPTGIAELVVGTRTLEFYFAHDNLTPWGESETRELKLITRQGADKPKVQTLGSRGPHFKVEFEPSDQLTLVEVILDATDRRPKEVVAFVTP